MRQQMLDCCSMATIGGSHNKALLQARAGGERAVVGMAAEAERARRRGLLLLANRARVLASSAAALGSVRSCM